MPDRPTHNFEYTQRVYDSVLDWYKNADAKAQIIFTLDGAFLTFLVDVLFALTYGVSHGD